MIKIIIGLLILPFVIFGLYIWYKIDEREQFFWMKNSRRCKKCNSTHHIDVDGNWHVSLKSSKYPICNCYTFSKSRKP